MIFFNIITITGMIIFQIQISVLQMINLRKILNSVSSIFYKFKFHEHDATSEHEKVQI